MHIYIEYESQLHENQEIQRKLMALDPQKFLVLHSPVKTDDTPTLNLSFRSERLGFQNLKLFEWWGGGRSSQQNIYKGSHSSDIVVSLHPVLSQLPAADTCWCSRCVTIRNNLVITIFCHHQICISGTRYTLNLLSKNPLGSMKRLFINKVKIFDPRAADKRNKNQKSNSSIFM